ncbi:TetR/AcrR family transcriptional regulator [Streptomyces yangpuensis]|uniref:TetR/AcrR family transcriptional regulator n=1 Tax=Streptomyces yangpuensis TaxID=1648182 RepID=UPI003663A3AC
MAEAPITERGPEGLTHRAVADRADVPLAPTTYHFTDREALIRAALERSAERFASFVRHWAKAHADAGPEQVVEALADSVMACPGEGRTAMVVEYELHAAALRRPELREAASLPARATPETLAPCSGRRPPRQWPLR